MYDGTSLDGKSLDIEENRRLERIGDTLGTWSILCLLVLSEGVGPSCSRLPEGRNTEEACL